MKVESSIVCVREFVAAHTEFVGGLAGVLHNR